MKTETRIIASSHSTARVRCDAVNNLDYIPGLGDDLNGPNIIRPYHFRVKVQIRLLRCIWVTVWSATVECANEAIAAAEDRARKLADSLSCTGL